MCSLSCMETICVRIGFSTKEHMLVGVAINWPRSKFNQAYFQFVCYRMIVSEVMREWSIYVFNFKSFVYLLSLNLRICLLRY